MNKPSLLFILFPFTFFLGCFLSADGVLSSAYGKGEPVKKMIPNDTFDGLKVWIASYGPDVPGQDRIEAETLRKDAIILPTDKTPVDVVLRRTQALLAHLKKMKGAPSFQTEEKELAELAKQNNPKINEEEQKKLFDAIKKVRRKIAFKNPLLNFDELLFLKHAKQRRGEEHMVDQYLGFNQLAQGGLYVLEKPFSEEPTVRSLLADSKVTNGRLKDKTLEDNGSFMSLELDWDAKKIYFAFTEAQSSPYPEGGKEKDQLLAIKNASGCKNHRDGYYAWAPERSFQIFSCDADGSNLTALTDDHWNDFDPCVLPNGRVVLSPTGSVATSVVVLVTAQRTRSTQ